MTHTPTLTFSQFQASGRDSDDITKESMADFWSDEGPIPGRVYLGALFIERANHANGKWNLILNNAEYLTDDLVALERRLYDFACDEGFCIAPAA